MYTRCNNEKFIIIRRWLYIINSALKGFKLSIIIFVLLFILFGTISAYKSYGKTWIIKDNKFKSVYKDYNDCIKNNLGTKTTKICNNKDKVYYINNK